MKECKECGGTGLAINDKFCRCVAGNVLKAEMLGVKKTVNAVNEIMYDFKMPKRINLKLGDWVDHNGVIGSVVEIDELGNQFKLITSPRETVKAQAWITYRGQKPLPLERFEDPETLKQLVDMALLFKDENWFNELVGGAK